MAAEAFRLRAELRRNWRAWLAVAVLVGVAGGTVLASLAGARRTSSAVDRFVTWSRVPDVEVETDDPQVVARLAHLPQVDAWEVDGFVAAMPVDDRGRPVEALSGATAWARGDHAGPRTRSMVLDGRLPDDHRVDEVAVNESAAAHGHLGVGSTVRLATVGPDQVQQFISGSGGAPDGPVVTVHVVGIVRRLTDVRPTQPPTDVVYLGNDSLYLTPAFAERHRRDVAIMNGLAVRLRHGAADAPAFTRAARGIVGGDVEISSTVDELVAAAQAKRSTRVEALALVIFAAIALVATAGVVGQLVGRQAVNDAGDAATLRSLGVTRRQLIRTAMARAASIAAAGAALAVLVAIGLSRFFPVGVARQAEIHPGVSVDRLVLGVGASVLVVAMPALAAILGWRQSGRLAPAVTSEQGAAAPGLVDAVGRAPLGIATATGVRLAFDRGRGTRTIPLWTSMLGSVVAVLVVVAALVFGADLSRFTTRPELHGWRWDAAVGNPHGDDLSARADPRLTNDHDVAAATAVAIADLSVDDESTTVVGLRPVKGPEVVPALHGRLPATSTEIALGHRTMRDLDVGIGDAVTMSDGQHRRRLRVVGEALIDPAIANDQVTLGSGAVVTVAGLHRLAPGSPASVYLVRFRAGADRAAVERRLRGWFPETVLTVSRPSDIANLAQVAGLPSLLAGGVAVLGLAALVHLLASTVRRRRRDLAVLGVLGFRRAQVRTVVHAQAAVVVVIALAVGLPLGVAAGRQAWVLLDGQLGVGVPPTTPWWILTTVPVALAAAVVAAWIPSRWAASRRPANALRTE